MPEKIIRDPVHDVIALRVDRPMEGLLFRLINSTEFQRLRRIRQLGLASLAYPGADHSRYSHSLGVMETARKILARLADDISIDPDTQTLCLAAALLHDLGHGPFSHVFERVSGIDHEAATARVILDPASQVHQLLLAYDRDLPRRLADFMAGQPRRTFYHDILSSQLDADRMDYLLRDNLMTGSQYGSYDLNWLLHALTVDPATNRLAVHHKGTSALEAYLQSRYHMYRNVYFHKVVRSAEGMIRLALQRAKRLAVQDRLPWPGREHAVTKSLLGQSLSPPEFSMLDDSSMLECLKAWSHGEDAPLAGLCRGLLFRRLFKVIDLSHLDNPDQWRQMHAAAETVVAQAGGDVAYDLFLDEPSDTPYEITFSPHGVSPAEGIFVMDPQGKLREFSAISPLSAALNRQLMFRRLHVQAHLKPEVEARILQSRI